MQLDQPAPSDPAARELFRSHPTLRAVIEAALEGRLGRVRVAGGGPHQVGMIELGCYTILAGAADAPEAADLIAAVRLPRELLVPPRQEWRDLVHAVLGGLVEDRPMRTFSPHRLDRAHLERQAKVGEKVVVRRVGREEAAHLDRGLEPHGLQVFPSLDEFVAHGFGCCAVADGVVVSQSTTYAVSSRRVEVAVGTRAGYRGRGLALAVASRMLLDCLERGLSPEWSASNPVSKRLALRLGYRPGPLCDSLFVRAPEDP